MIRRTGLLVAAVVAAGLVLAAGAAAYWSAAGAGQGIAATGSVGQVTGVDTSLHGTIAATAIDVGWSPVAVTAGVAVTYVVEKHAGASKSVVCTTTASGCTVGGLTDGLTRYAVTAQINGWAGTASALTAGVKVSTAAPTITAKPSSPTATATASIDFSHGAFATFRCALDGAGPTTCPRPVALAALADGQHTFTVAALDANGVATQAATVAWTVRTDEPTITASPPATTTQKTASFAFSHSAYTSFRCRLDGAAFAACTSPTVWSSLAAGSHTFRVEAVDGDGLATRIAAYTWTIT